MWTATRKTLLSLNTFFQKKKFFLAANHYETCKWFLVRHKHAHAHTHSDAHISIYMSHTCEKRQEALTDQWVDSQIGDQPPPSSFWNIIVTFTRLILLHSCGSQLFIYSSDGATQSIIYCCLLASIPALTLTERSGGERLARENWSWPRGRYKPTRLWRKSADCHLWRAASLLQVKALNLRLRRRIISSWLELAALCSRMYLKFAECTRACNHGGRSARERLAAASLAQTWSAWAADVNK